ncbi:hypothetical protein CLH62_20350 [Marinobacter guineae]|uniref:Roadblock/LAMTOR2 domain-containing protein n=1 Tax=Marinobacter guineae TaxID=432303 RepID=A0A2G1VA49_9GAMM|nr:roadblock/LC7 domain-containing protein [Marinobacter guineae]PHQ23633.1 hypothetical protein CLH62_20350 [Marinobacter guineae]
MSTAEIEKELEEFCLALKDIKSSMIISPDGLVIAKHGPTHDQDLFAALFLELKVVCEKILFQLNCDDIEEIYIRSKSGSVTVFPLFDKGYLACISSANINAGKIQIFSWKFARRIYSLL